MKNIFLMMAAMLMLSACTSNQKNNTEDTLQVDTMIADSNALVDASPGHICFLHTEGTLHTDSTKVHLIIDGDNVSGQMQWVPFQKDARKGTLQGTQNGNTIKAVWTYMQEGMEDTLAVEFNFNGNKLKQKPYIVNKENGRQQTDNTAGYIIVFGKKECDEMSW